MDKDKKKLLNNIKLIKDTLENIDNIDNTNDIEIRIVFFQRNQSEKDKKLKAIELVSGKNIFQNALKKVIINASTIVNEQPFVSCDIEIPKEDHIEVLEKTHVGDIDLITSKLNDIENMNILNDDINFNNLDFMAIKIKGDIDVKDKDNNNIHLEDMIIFKKYFPPNTAFKQSFKYIFNDSQPKVIKDNVLVLTSNVDCIYFNNKFYIDNRKSFMSIFKFDEYFKKKILDNKKSIEVLNIFDNVDNLVDITTTDKTLQKKMYKALYIDGFKKLVEDKTTAPDIVNVAKEYNLPLSLNTNNMIEIINKESIQNIFKVIEHRCVVDALTQKKLIALGIEEEVKNNGQ